MGGYDLYPSNLSPDKTPHLINANGAVIPFHNTMVHFVNNNNNNNNNNKSAPSKNIKA